MKIFLFLSLFISTIFSVRAQFDQLGTPQGMSVWLHSSSIAVHPGSVEPYIAFATNSASGVRVARYTAGAWSDVGGLLPNVEAESPVVIGFQPGTNSAFVAFANSSSQYVVYTYNGFSWIQVGSFAGAVYGFSSISLSFEPVTNNPTVALLDINTGTYRAHMYDGSSWNQIGSDFGACNYQGHISLEFNSVNGEPVVAFNSAPNVYQVSAFSGGNWTSIGSPFGTADITGSIELAFNSSTNEPYVIYNDFSLNSFIVRKFDGLNWNQIGGALGSSTYNAGATITFNPLTNEPWVSYLDGALNRVATEKYVGTNWVQQDLSGVYINPSSAASALCPDLTFDQNGNLFLTYVEQTDAQVVTEQFCMPVTNTITATATGCYYSAAGNYYDTSGSYTETFTAENGCDSILTINLTINPGICPTQAGAALSFDGVDDEIVLDPFGINGNSPRTVEMWIRATNTGDFQTPFASGTPTTGQTFNIKITPTGHLGFMGFFTDHYPSTGRLIADGTYHHIAISYDGTNVKGYIDGTLEWSEPLVLNTIGTNNFLGRSNHVGYEQYLTGTLDEVRVWIEERTACQIRAYMNAEIPTTESGLVANYHFNQGIASMNNAGETGLIDGAAQFYGTLYNFDLLGGVSNWVYPGGVVSGFSTPASLGSAAVTNVTCFGGNNGVINLTPTGGTAPYTFNWGGGITSEDRTGLAAGTYSVDITDAVGCTSTVSATISEPMALSATTVVTNVACFGGNTGAINLTPTGGTGPYTFDWGGGITSEDRTGLTAGTYSVTIADNNGCTASVSATVSEPSAALSGTTVVTNVACFGGSNGAINLTPTGGTGPYTFNWGGGITSEDRTGLTAGTYSVDITDNNGCTASVSATVSEPSAALSGTTVVANVACFGGTTGAINLTPIGGTGPYTFNWGGGITSEDRTGLTAGTYLVTITDNNGCTASVSATLTEPSAALSGTTVVTNVACFGGNTGAINLTPAGGTGPYTFNWGGGITSEDRTGLAAGNYSVTITDLNGCSAAVSATLTEPSAALSGTTVVTNVACFGGSNGAINLTPTGGTGPYTFNWGGGITSEDRTGLTAGTYSVTITDNNGCTASVSATLTEPSATLSGTTVVTNVSCFGGNTGAINLTPTGGTSPYTFNWGGGITSEDRTGLAAGTYSVTITDNNGCTATISATLTEPSASLSGTTVVTNVACFGGNTGAINLTPTGGTAPYTFNWGGGITSEDRTGLTAGTYSVNITDNNGCTASVSATLTEPSAALSGTTVVTNVACFGGNTGSINLTPAGGTGPYTFDWGGGITSEDRTGLAAGTYSVTITDLNGCTASVSATISEPSAALSGTTVVTNVACFGGTTGAINLTPIGGTGPYTFNWGGGITSEDRTGLAAGTYSVDITDNNGCAASVSATVSEPSAALSGTTVVTNVACFGGNTGAINLTPAGGTGPYTFNWGGGITSEDRTGLAAGTYSVTITDLNGCTASVSATISEPSAALSGTTVVTNVACFGGSNGAINLTPVGGTGPYTFNWGGGITSEDRTGLTAGTYSVTITDNNGCMASVSATLTEPSAALSGTTVVTNVACFGGTTGAINLTPAGGTAPYAFNWGGGITSEDRTGLTAGTYSVTITDNNGCSAVVSATLTEPSTALSGTTVVTNVACFGGTTGAINLTPAGGTGPYTFNWGGGITSEDRTGLAAGTYSVTITDLNGCTATVSATISEPSAALSGTTVVTNVACFGGNTGAINLTPAGGTGPYTFNWGGGITSEDRTGLSAGTYAVTITDDNGCTTSVSATVSEPLAALTGTTVVTNVACFGGNTGAINLTPAGGTGPYTFNWGSGITSEDRTGLTAGTYTVDITDANGCNTTISWTITEAAAITGSETVVACDSYVWAADGQLYTSNGTYTAMLTAANGCDSLATLNLSLLQSTQSDVYVTNCQSYVWNLTGATYTSTGLYQTNLVNSVGCDSIILLHLTILPATGSSQTITANNSYTWPLTGMTYTTSGTYQAILGAVNGCDSIITLYLTVQPPIHVTQTISACDTYQWIDGNTYTTSTNTPTMSYTAANGADSIVTLNLTIWSTPVATAMNTGAMLQASSAANYQWLDCATGLPINGANGQTFTPTVSGSYAAVLTNGTCSDTSACVSFSPLKTEELSDMKWILYPNPATDYFILEFDAPEAELTLLDAAGKILLRTVTHSGEKITLPEMSRGVYIVQMQSGVAESIQRLIVN